MEGRGYLGRQQRAGGREDEVWEGEGCLGRQEGRVVERMRCGNVVSRGCRTFPLTLLHPIEEG